MIARDLDHIADLGERNTIGLDSLFDREVRFRATLGNHDIITRNGRPELNEARFGMNGRNYVVREGGVRFVMVDSNDLRRRWLRGALQAEEGDRWTVVVFHHPVYSSSKHGLVGFSWSLREEVKTYGVGVSVVCPGFVSESGMFHHWSRGEKPPAVAPLTTMPTPATAITVAGFARGFGFAVRIGLVASTVLFALAHFTYGNPLLLIGVTIISLIIGITFYRTKNVIPGILAHGVFDAIQLFVIVPFAFRMMGAGG